MLKLMKQMMTEKRCSNVCWGLMELVEHQTELIKKLALEIKELEAILAGIESLERQKY